MEEKITYNQAVSEAKELWKAIRNSGMSSKDSFLNTFTLYRQKTRDYVYGCSLCQYAFEKDGRIPVIRVENEDECSSKSCPLFLQYGKSCYQLGFRESGHTDSFPESIESLLPEAYVMKPPEPKYRVWEDVTSQCNLVLLPADEGKFYISLQYQGQWIAEFGIDSKARITSKPDYKIETGRHTLIALPCPFKVLRKTD